MPQLNRPLTPTLRTPVPVSSDSDAVRVAVETARALETRGDAAEAAKWLRRAANEAEKQGHDARVLAFAHAAADLTNVGRQPPRPAVPPPRASEPSDSSEPTIRSSEVEGAALRSSALEGVASPPDSSLGTTPGEGAFEDEESSAPTIPPPTPREIGRPAPLRLGAIRIAIQKPDRKAKHFSVERLDTDERLPAGMIEAMLVLPDDIDDAPDPKVKDPVRSPSKR